MSHLDTMEQNGITLDLINLPGHYVVFSDNTVVPILNALDAWGDAVLDGERAAIVFFGTEALGFGSAQVDETCVPAYWH